MSDLPEQPSPPSQAARPTRPVQPAAKPSRSKPVDALPPAPAASPSQRPPRPAAPTPRRDPRADAPVIPQGFSLADPGLSEVTALRPVAPRPGHSLAAQQQARAAALRQTLLPSCLVLGITLPLLGAGWFALDRFSVARDNPLGIVLPVALFGVGFVFCAVTAMMWTQSLKRPTSASAD